MKKIIISSNLFMNVEATKTTLSKLQPLSPHANIVIINNAEPAYGGTTVNGFQSLGYERIHEMTVSIVALEEQIKYIQKADVVVLTGGNPYPLLRALKETKILDYVKEDSILVGVSAGAMVLGAGLDFLKDLSPELYEETPLDTFNWLNNHSVIPHANEEGYFSKEKMAEVIKKTNIPFILLDQFDEELSTI